MPFFQKVGSLWPLAWGSHHPEFSLQLTVHLHNELYSSTFLHQATETSAEILKKAEAMPASEPEALQLFQHSFTPQQGTCIGAEIQADVLM